MFYGQNMAMTERDPMLKKFGKDRVRIAPISETAEIGIGIGAAMTGLRPIVELWMSEFMLVAFDQVINEAPRLRYMSGGQVKVPVVFKAGFGFAAGWAGQHSNCIYHAHDGNSRPESRGPVYARRCQGPYGGSHSRRQSCRLSPSLHADARQRRSARRRVRHSSGSCGHQAPRNRRHDCRNRMDGQEGRWLRPSTWRKKASVRKSSIRALWRRSTCKPSLTSVKKTGRLVLVDQAPRHSSAAVVIAGEVAEHGFEYLRAPVKMVTALDTPVPYSEPLENYILPNEDKIVQAVKSVLAHDAVAA